jgi:zinc transporter ZupT
MIDMHPLAPAVAASMVLVMVAMLLPAAKRDRFAEALGRAERRVAMAGLLLAALLGFWLLRLTVIGGPGAG